jgi:hypothetical protein
VKAPKPILTITNHDLFIFGACFLAAFVLGFAGFVWVVAK